MSTPTIQMQIDEQRREIDSYLPGKDIFLMENGKYNDEVFDKMVWNLSRLYEKQFKRCG